MFSKNENRKYEIKLNKHDTNCCAKKLNHQLLGKTHVTLYYPDQSHTQDNKDLLGSVNDAYVHGEK